MRFFKKLFIAFAIIGVLGGGFYFVFDRPQESVAEGNPLLNLFLGDQKDISGESGGGILSDSKEFIDDKIASIKESVKGSVEVGVKEKQGEFLNYLKGSANEAIDTVQEKVVGAEKSGGSVTVLPVVKSGANAHFLISNPESSGEVGYEIDWGDGKTENGVLTGANKTVSHSWSEKGEYSVVFKTSAVSGLIKVIVTE